MTYSSSLYGKHTRILTVNAIFSVIPHGLLATHFFRLLPYFHLTTSRHILSSCGHSPINGLAKIASRSIYCKSLCNKLKKKNNEQTDKL